MNVMIFGDRLFSFYMAWGFEELGHAVHLIFPKSKDELQKQIHETDPELFITLGSPSFYKPEQLEVLKSRPSKKAKFIHWDTDGITWKEIEMNHIRLMEPDMVFTVCPEMLSLLKSQGIHCDMLQYAYCPMYHHPGTQDASFVHAISFMGSAYPTVLSAYPGHYRRISMDILFKPLLENGRRIDLYGDNRHKQVLQSLYGKEIPDAWLHGRCPFEKTWQVYSGSAINLVTQNHEHTLTMRTFEILGSGGLALSLSNAAIKETFTPGKDLAVSSGPSETLELVNFYLTHPDAADMVRKNALTSIQPHTYRQRAECIVSRLMPA